MGFFTALLIFSLFSLFVFHKRKLPTQEISWLANSLELKCNSSYLIQYRLYIKPVPLNVEESFPFFSFSNTIFFLLSFVPLIFSKIYCNKLKYMGKLPLVTDSIFLRLKWIPTFTTSQGRRQDFRQGGAKLFFPPQITKKRGDHAPL